MRRALIIAAEGAQDIEVLYPYYRLLEDGFAVEIAAPEVGWFAGIQGMKIEATRGTYELAALMPDLDLLILPGGVRAMEKLRLIAGLVDFIEEFHKRGGVIGSMCSGAQLLISAGLCKGRRISAYYAMRVDVENAGAEFVDQPAVVFDRIVSSPHYRHLGPWMRAVLDTLEAEALIARHA